VKVRVCPVCVPQLRRDAETMERKFKPASNDDALSRPIPQFGWRILFLYCRRDLREGAGGRFRRKHITDEANLCRVHDVVGIETTTEIWLITGDPLEHWASNWVPHITLRLESLRTSAIAAGFEFLSTLIEDRMGEKARSSKRAEARRGSRRERRARSWKEWQRSAVSWERRRAS
jgi:hypothetical protein